MKITFTQPELEWIRNSIQKMAMLLGNDVEKPLKKQIINLHYKFASNAAYCWLNREECALIHNLAVSRQNNVSVMQMVQGELEIVSSIEEKTS